jgi:hypothetical protein
MSNGQSKQQSTTQASRRALHLGIAFAVLLSLASWTLILLIPTSSINVDTVYEGF